MTMSRVESTIVLITGGNTGIGFAVAEALLLDPIEKPYTILITSRSLSRAAQATEKLNTDPAYKSSFDLGSQVFPFELDQDDDNSIERLRKKLGEDFGRIDVLVNNAGIALDYDVLAGRMTIREAFTKTFRTNVTSVHCFTEAMVDLLLKSLSARIIFVSSSVGSLTWQATERYSIDQPPPAGWPKEPSPNNVTSYRTSKTAENMMILEWQRLLRNDPVTIHLINPGLLATGLGGLGAEVMKENGAGDPITGGKFIRSVIEGERDGDLGHLIELGGRVPCVMPGMSAADSIAIAMAFYLPWKVGNWIPTPETAQTDLYNVNGRTMPREPSTPSLACGKYKGGR